MRKVGGYTSLIKVDSGRSVRKDRRTFHNNKRISFLGRNNAPKYIYSPTDRASDAQRTMERTARKTDKSIITVGKFNFSLSN